MLLVSVIITLERNMKGEKEMANFEINENTITSKNIWNTDVFQIVEKIPAGFFVWNIGDNMGSNEWIPICEDLHPNDKNDYSINRKTLKAINLPTEKVEKLRKAASVGIVSLETAEKASKSHRNGYWSNKKREQAEKVIDIFRRISK